ncbi:alcohol dehydrogenase catalytic domain-containing protein [Nonomuraea helvata]|uniref:alcohol dehydrogenase n=1 Tax=Nonomuraea helvata TaxID=37484 RepID=A0ABV5S0R3_9ACTN
MRAAVVTGFDKPLEIQELPVPEPEPYQVLVRIEASGLCHTDIHAAHGDWPVKPSLPFTPGHEGVGVIEKIGSAVTGREVGERVAIPWLGSACGTCEYCVSGRENLCESQQNTGYALDGGHAEYAVAHAGYVVPVPQSVSPVEAAPLTCAGVTTYKAVKVSGLRPSERAAIFGIGGLGHLAQQYAQIFGAQTIAVDVTEDKLRLARELGAAHTVNAATGDPVAEIKALGGVDVAVVLAANPRVLEQAHACLRRGGRLVLVSLPKDNAMSAFGRTTPCATTAGAGSSR